MIRVLFVCLGNICRSPLAEGIMEHQLSQFGLEDQVQVSSAGTGTWHLGHEPDERTLRVAEANGLRLSSIAQHVEDKPLEKFDYIIVMDENNRADVEGLPMIANGQQKVYLMRDFDPEAPELMAVPDPYMGGSADFDEVYRVLDRSVREFIQFLQQNHDLKA